MPLNTVQTYLKGLLDQLTLPGNLGALNAFIAPPDPGDGTQPSVYIWGSTGEEARQSMPRAAPGRPSTGGFKIVMHRVDLWVIWFGSPDDPDVDVQFPTVIDAVTAVLRTTLMPVLALADPVTGGLSDLLAVGEEISWDYAPVTATEDERWWVYTARIIAPIREKLQA